jgi:DNA-binding HxlR family transcriptional regulator
MRGEREKMSREDHITDLETVIAELDESTTGRFELLIRTLSPPAGPHRSQEQLLQRLEALEERELVDSTAVRIWGPQIPTQGAAAETRVGRTALETIERLQQWQQESGHSIIRFFEKRTVDATMCDEYYSVIVPPSQCLLAYVEGELRSVIPCQVGSEMVSVSDFLDMIDREASDRPDEESPPSRSTTPG